MENKTQIPYAKIGILSLAHAINDNLRKFSAPAIAFFWLFLSANFTATRAAHFSFRLYDNIFFSTTGLRFLLGPSRQTLARLCRNLMDGYYCSA